MTAILRGTLELDAERGCSATPPRSGSRLTGGVVGWATRRIEVAVAFPTEDDGL